MRRVPEPSTTSIVGGSDHFIITHAATGLDDRSRARLRDHLSVHDDVIGQVAGEALPDLRGLGRDLRRQLHRDRSARRDRVIPRAARDWCRRGLGLGGRCGRCGRPRRRLRLTRLRERGLAVGEFLFLLLQRELGLAARELLFASLHRRSFLGGRQGCRVVCRERLLRRLLAAGGERECGQRDRNQYVGFSHGHDRSLRVTASGTRCAGRALQAPARTGSSSRHPSRISSPERRASPPAVPSAADSNTCRV